MKIIRANAYDTDIFSKKELDFGACCFYSEDRALKYFFEIKGRDATLYTNVIPCENQFLQEAIDNFLFYSGFIVTIKDTDGNILRENPQNKPYLHEILKIQPSQFYINEKKLIDCKKWIKSYEDIFVPIVIKDGISISQDGHTRLRAALDLGFTSVYAYQEDYSEHIFHFTNEAKRRGINSISDMEILSDEDYVLKWHKYCDDYFNRTGENSDQ